MLDGAVIPETCQGLYLVYQWLFDTWFTRACFMRPLEGVDVLRS